MKALITARSHATIPHAARPAFDRWVDDALRKFDRSTNDCFEALHEDGTTVFGCYERPHRITPDGEVAVEYFTVLTTPPPALPAPWVMEADLAARAA